MSKPATKTVRYYILSAIGIAIMLFFRFLPPMGTVTELGMNVLGIFLGAIWCFSTVGTFWPALLALVLFGTSGLKARIGHFVEAQILEALEIDYIYLPGWLRL